MSHVSDVTSKFPAIGRHGMGPERTDVDGKRDSSGLVPGGDVLRAFGREAKSEWEELRVRERNARPRLTSDSFNTFFYADEMVGGKQGKSERHEFSERSVPSSSMGRAWGFGTTGLNVALGAASSWMTGGGVWSAQSADALAAGLCRLRGAATKLGQIVSLQDESFLPPAAAEALERVRTQADVMPRRQLEQALKTELGEDVLDKFGGPWTATEDGFVGLDLEPVAAASIGQVHRAKLPDGQLVAVKVQYPGVAESVDADLNNVRRLLVVSGAGGALPRGLFLDSVIAVAREELSAECDYELEAQKQEEYGLALKEALRESDNWSPVAVGIQEAEERSDAPEYLVPKVLSHLSSKRVLTTEWVHGIPIDKCRSLPQEQRNELARRLLRLVLTELFILGRAQTDPNFGNTLIQPETLTMNLIDFGATREYPHAFLDEYLRLVWSAASRDETALLEASLRSGFLTGHESDDLLRSHVDAGLIVGEPFIHDEPFDFAKSNITKRASQHAAAFAQGRLTPPPREVYSLHRKLSGAFFICIRLGAVIQCRDMLLDVIRNHNFITKPLERIEYKDAAARAREADETSIFWAAKRAAIRAGRPEAPGSLEAEKQRWQHLENHDNSSIRGFAGLGGIDDRS